MRMLLGVVAFVAIFAPAAAAAQETQDMIPRELALALLGMVRPLGEDSEILVGEMPGGLRDRIPLPARGRLLGGLTHGAGRTILALAVPLETSAAATATEIALEAAGWTRAEDPPGSRRGGFQPFETTGPRILCADGESVWLNASAAGSDHSHVLLSFTQDPADRCSERYRRPGRLFEEAPMPPLHAPEGVKMAGGGMSSTSGRTDDDPTIVSSSVQLETSLSPAALVEHFDGQLRSAGWRAKSRGGAEGVAWSSWHAEAEDGGTWFGHLLVIEIPESNWRSASLHLRRLAAGE